MWAGVLVAIALGVYIWRRWSTYNKNLPPGPFNIPLLGSWELIKLYLLGGSRSEMYARLGARYGPVIFMRMVMDTPVIAIRTYDVIKEASKDNLLGGMRLPYMYRMASNWNNYGLSFCDGEDYQRNRKFTLRTLHKLGKSNARLETLANYECATALENMMSKEGEPVDITYELTLANTNSLFQVLMSRRFNLHDSQLLALRNSFRKILQIFAKTQTYLDFFPWLSTFSGENSDRKTLEKILDSIYHYVDDAIQEHQATLQEQDEPRDMIDAYLFDASRQHGDRMSTEDLRVLVKDWIFGGLEGPNVSLTWTVMLVAANPDVQAKVHDEIDSVIGPDRAPSEDDEKDCPYIRAVIDEMFRYVTMTPFNRHFTSMGATTLLGYHIPANSVILVDQNSLHHDPQVWGDPEKFRPERFLTEEGHRLREHVHGFGISPRTCPAKTYSRSLLFLFLVGLFQKTTMRIPESKSADNDFSDKFVSRVQRPFVIVERRDPRQQV